LKPTQYPTAKQALETDLRDATIIQLTDDVLLQTIHLLETHPLRSSDAIQLASALVWGADQFISADMRQCASARSAGLNVVQL
jgi:predicted nucleic acid-binding protein